MLVVWKVERQKGGYEWQPRSRMRCGGNSSSTATIRMRWSEKYDGKVVAIKGGEVLGAYDSLGKALNETQKTHELGILPDTEGLGGQ